MNEQLSGMYGRGWAFPPRFTKEQGVAMVVDQEDIRQSLRIMFSTQPGERIMRPEFGCDLQSAVFENIREELLADISAKINDSILRDEPRVTVESLQLTQDPKKPSQLNLQLIYRIRGTDSAGQLTGQLDLGDGRRSRFI